MDAVPTARAMRKAFTPPEARMWAWLKTLRGEGFQFRRQAPFRGYFLDFVCNRARLVVEVDGASHEHRAEHDAVRDAVLLREGYRTLRIAAVDVRDNFEGVADFIKSHLVAATPHPTASRPPSPQGAGIANRQGQTHAPRSRFR